MNEKDIIETLKKEDSKITIFSKSHCQKCEKLKKQFAEAGIKFDVITYEENQDIVIQKARSINNFAMPFIEVNSELIGHVESMRLGMNAA